MNMPKVSVRPGASKAPPSAVQRLHREAEAAGEAELARACEAALAGDPAARAALSLALADDDDCEPCPVTLASGGAS